MVALYPSTAPFSALAEPHRRRILELVSGRELPVGDLVTALGLDQPAVSKHLRALREASLVRVRKDGRRRLYSSDPAALAPLRAWIEQLERLWDTSLERVAKRAEERARASTDPRSTT